MQTALGLKRLENACTLRFIIILPFSYAISSYMEQSKIAEFNYQGYVPLRLSLLILRNTQM